jgi:hypothetical protein
LRSHAGLKPKNTHLERNLAGNEGGRWKHIEASIYTPLHDAELLRSSQDMADGADG